MTFSPGTSKTTIEAEQLKNELEDLNAYCDSVCMTKKEREHFIVGSIRNSAEAYCDSVGLIGKDREVFIENSLKKID